MTEARKQTGTKIAERAKANETKQTLSEGWEALIADFPVAIRRKVSALAGQDVSLADLLLLEQANYLDLRARIKWARKQKQLRHEEKLTSALLQSRKNMRVILLAMGPTLTTNDQPVRLPDGFTLSLTMGTDGSLDIGDDLVD